MLVVYCELGKSSKNYVQYEPLCINVNIEKYWNLTAKCLQLPSLSWWDYVWVLDASFYFP